MHPDLLNRDLKEAQYAVRGELYLKADELRKSGREIIFTNVGNPHNLGQKPLTFIRQVLALTTAPFLMDNPEIVKQFPADAVSRARSIIKSIGSGVGAYSDSRGYPWLRQEIADFIQRRDGHPSNPDHIFCTDGASVSVRMALNAIIRDEQDAIMVPIPQYPLYSAAIRLYGGSLEGYYLDEPSGWQFKMDELKRSVNKARKAGKDVRALVFINPGNPTGQCLSRATLEGLAKFAYEERLVLMADEVYQENIFQSERPFVSMKQVLAELGGPISKEQELISFHTVSKGVYGECGLRGGYMECVNVHPGTIDEMYKISSINLSPNTIGQVALSLMCNPPKKGEPSHASYYQEKQTLHDSLIRRAHIMTDGFNALENVSCVFTEGVMYSFPRLHLPPKAVEAAKKAGKAPDTFYCLHLLEETGISVVPGSGFGQKEGEFHLRTTILPSEEKMKEVVEKYKSFNAKFMAKYK